MHFIREKNFLVSVPLEGDGKEREDTYCFSVDYLTVCHAI